MIFGDWFDVPEDSWCREREEEMAEQPKRIQRSRAKGWRMPPNTVYVGRPSKWGNPFGCGHSRLTPQDRLDCVDLFRRWIVNCQRDGVVALDGLELLRGKDLACWCPVGEPCHADVLLEIANSPELESAQ